MVFSYDYIYNLIIYHRLFTGGTYMRRKCTDSLIQWKKNPHRHPLLLQGLRQTGKTWLALDFAEKNYKNTLYLNLETDKPVADYLSIPRPPQDALLFLETYAGKPLLPSVSLLILDNIQCVPELSTLLAAISLDHPQYHILAIHRGLASPELYNKNDFDIISLYPLDFEEFLWANAEYALSREIRRHFSTLTPLGKELHQKALSQFYLYLVTGGMPLSVLEYRKEKKLLMVPDIQQKLLELILGDISSQAPTGMTRHCQNAWLSIPAQLEKSNRRFQYSLITKGATAKTYEKPLDWLLRSGYALACRQTSLHLYPTDCGLCARVLGVPSYQLLTGSDTPAARACTETFLAQHFTRNGYTLSYWSSGNQAEVPFLLEKEGRHIAVDYRLTPHQKTRNLTRFRAEINTNAEMYLLSVEDFREKENYHIVPVYAGFCV